VGEEIVAIDPQNVRGYISLGEIYLEMGNIEQAKAIYKKVINLDPKTEPFVRNKLNEQLKN